MNKSADRPKGVAGIVLAGGRSARMGRDKATLPFGPELLVQRVVRILSEVTSPVVVVAAAEQQLPPLSPDVLLARDERPARGPLEGLRAGLARVAAERPDVAAAFATSCDVPLLSAAFVRAMIDRLGDADLAVPVEGDFSHPLAAVYRVTLLPQIESLLAGDRLRPAYLFDSAVTVPVPVESLRGVDPELLSLKNCNQPEDYEAALRTAGFA
jgi:molybdopterin-guanine dinucleotide biosynthesis protein A